MNEKTYILTGKAMLLIMDPNRTAKGRGSEENLRCFLFCGLE
jgi:hypothetical protein